MTDIAERPSTASIGTGATGAAAPLVRDAKLQYLRGIAALAVVLFHASDYMAHTRADGRFLGVFTSFFGIYGVATFFVLSGYLMARLSTRSDPWRFILERILRIYPLLLIVVGLTALGYLVTGFARRPDPLALTLIPAGRRDYMLGIEWTLLFEITYYTLICTMMVLGRRKLLAPLFAAWLVMLAGSDLLGLGPAATLTPTLTQLFGQSANSAFLAGFLLPLVLGSTRLPPAAVLLALALPLAGFGFFLSETAMRWVAGASALLVVAAALTSPPASGRGVLHRFGLRLGDASYALYLCHVPLIIITGNLLPASLPAFVPGWLLWASWIAASLAIALALGPFDVAMHVRLKAWAAALPQRTVTRIGWSFLALFAGIALYCDVRDRLISHAEKQARLALSKTPPQPIASLLTGIDSSAVLADGRLILRGYGIDLDRPDDDSHIAIFQRDGLIGLDRMTRMRTGTAREAGRPDIASVRFGFGVVSAHPLDCTAGPLSARLILSDGRVAPIMAPLLDQVCAGKGARR